MVTTKVKIGLIILSLAAIVVGGLFILSELKPQEIDIQLQDITTQPKDTSCQSELMRKQAKYLGLSCKEFNILSTSIREYLYETYLFLRNTEFGIRYEKVSEKLKSVPQESIIINAYANFRTPPVIIKVALYNEKVYLISIGVPRDDA